LVWAGKAIRARCYISVPGAEKESGEAAAMEDKGMIKGFRQIALLTAVSRVLGMVRDMALAHFFGAGWLMTAWTVGFKVPNLARRLFGEGAASASFIPVYSQELLDDRQRAEKLAGTMLTAVALVVSAIVVVGELLVWSYYWFFETRSGPRIGLALCGIMLPYMVMICLVAILGGILNVHRRFGTPAAAPIVLNVFIIAGITLGGWWLGMEPQRLVFLVAGAVLAAGLVQIGIQVPSLRAAGLRIQLQCQFGLPAFKKVLVLMGPMILGLTVTQLNTLADDIIALCFMNERGIPLGYGAPSYLYYAQRLYQFPLGVLGISLATAIFPVMSSDAARRDFAALTVTISRGIKAALFVALPATAGIFLVARALITAVFEHGRFTSTDTPVVAGTLCFYAIGLCGYFCQQLSTRAFYSLQEPMIPVKSALIAVAVNVVLNLILIWFLGTGGLAFSTALCSYLQVLLLVSALQKRIHRPILTGFRLLLVKVLAATALMCAAAALILWLMRSLGQSRLDNVLRLTAVVPAAVVVYIAAAKLLRIEMLSVLMTGPSSGKGKDTP